MRRDGHGGPRLRDEAASAFGTTGSPSEAPTAPSDSCQPKPWQTPDAQGFHSRKQVGASERELMLTGETKSWATPRAIYAEHPGMQDESHLTGQAQTTGGKGSLNPAFTLALMGFPPEWFCVGVMIQRAKPKRPKGKGRPKE